MTQKSNEIYVFTINSILLLLYQKVLKKVSHKNVTVPKAGNA
jgi:hypothetical protein